MSDIVEDRAYPLAEACDRLGGISKPTFYRLVAAGRLRAHKLGSRTVVRHSEIVAFLDSLPAVDPEATT